MATNRLQLNFQIETSIERKNFIEQYLQSKTFEKFPPTQDELEMMGNYILWGKEEDGKSLEQKKEIQIERRKQTWVSRPEESLDALLANPSFNEGSLNKLSLTMRPTKKEKFSRENALRNAPPHLYKIYEELFEEIDTLDLQINYADLKSGKRKNPIREELSSKFSQTQHLQFKKIGESWNYFTYLKQRHRLVELRTRQFEIRDSFLPTLQKKSPIPQTPPSNTTFYFGADLPILPLGLFSNQNFSKLIFHRTGEIQPSSLTTDQLEKISLFLQSKEKEQKESKFFSFLELEHVYQLLLSFQELASSFDPDQIESTTGFLLRTLFFYISMGNLTDLQKEILVLKIRKVKNQDIIERINQRYGKMYTANYISTIFRQKIIREINQTAARHLEIISHLETPEDFKRCGDCGKFLLRNSFNFVKKNRSKDGFSNRCKICEKKKKEIKSTIEST